MQDFRNLGVWQQSHQLTLNVYAATEDFPPSELYGLRSQLPRASASIAANIAEGCGRNSGADFARFLTMSSGSASEVEYHLILASDLKLISPASYEQMTAQVQEVKRMLSALIRRVNPQI